MKILLSTLIILSLMVGNTFAAAHHGDALQLKGNIHQPYIVQPGDTLSDIAHHLFRNPEQWLNIWEHNLSITNPDLIYPGNKIWFNPQQKKHGGLRITRSHPEIHILPVQRGDPKMDHSLMLSILQRHDLIAASAEVGIGRIIDAPDGRLNFGAGDPIYVRLDQTANVGDRFDIFRNAATITPPGADHPIGLLIAHVGQLKIESKAEDGLYRATITRAFEEITRGDHLKPAQRINPHITPMPPSHAMHGQIIHIRNAASEAGQHQVVAIDLGTKDGVTQGTLLTVRKKGRIITDKTTDQPVQLPSENIATLLVINPQPIGSLALVTQSTTAINLGDQVIGTPTNK
ncbi:MAG: LysM peptidoglycan-binding domain-containing protein [Mariprofundales bacterium]|nr:LysM peptidoglycan-binding domain-containing protein [Mariprofundales bacterium]